MKTAEEVLAQRFNTTSDLLDTSAHCRVSSALEAMKSYASEVAKEVLYRAFIATGDQTILNTEYQDLLK